MQKYTMPVTTIAYGVFGIALGVLGYIVTEEASKTALIPAFIGIVFVLLGFAAFAEGIRKHVMHAAAAIALLSILGPGVRLAMVLPKSGLTTAATYQIVYIIGTIGFLAACINSFIQARKARKAAESGS